MPGRLYWLNQNGRRHMVRCDRGPADTLELTPVPLQVQKDALKRGLLIGVIEWRD